MELIVLHSMFKVWDIFYNQMLIDISFQNFIQDCFDNVCVPMMLFVYRCSLPNTGVYQVHEFML